MAKNEHQPLAAILQPGEAGADQRVADAPALAVRRNGGRRETDHRHGPGAEIEIQPRERDIAGDALLVRHQRQHGSPDPRSLSTMSASTAPSNAALSSA